MKTKGGTVLNIYQPTRRHVTADTNLVPLLTHNQVGELHNLTSFHCTGMRISVIRPNQLRCPPSLLSNGCGTVRHTAIGHRLMTCICMIGQEELVYLLVKGAF